MLGYGEATPADADLAVELDAVGHFVMPGAQYTSSGWTIPISNYLG